MKNVIITLSGGKTIKLELFREIAPETVDNFVELVENGFYDGLCFHRVIEGFMIQGGGFVHKDALVPKKAPHTIKGEFASNGVKNDLSHKKGVISMARTMVPDSASSQFFICVEDVPYLDGNYAAFGKTVDEESLKNAIEISRVKTHNLGGYGDVPVEPVVIESIKMF